MGESNDKFFAIRGVAFQWTFLLLAASYICLPIYNSSFFGDLERGRWLLNNVTSLGGITAPHELWEAGGVGVFNNWYYEILLAFFDLLGGFTGIIIFKVGLIFATFLTASYFSYRLSGHRFFAVFITLAAGMGGFYANEMTASLFNILLFVGYVSFIHKLLTLRKKKTIGIIFVITILLIILHTNFDFLLYGSAGADIAHKSIISLYNYQFAFLLILSAVALLFCYMDRFRQTKKEVVLVALCFLMAAFDSSLACHALFIISFVCAYLWGKFGIEKLGNLAHAVDTLSKKFDFIPTSGFAFLLCCISIVFIHRLMLIPVVVEPPALSTTLTTSAFSFCHLEMERPCPF